MSRTVNGHLGRWRNARQGLYVEAKLWHLRWLVWQVRYRRMLTMWWNGQIKGRVTTHYLLAATLLAAVLVLAASIPGQPPVKEVSLQADGRVYTLSTRAVTVQAALAEAGIVVGAQDWVKPGLGELLTEGARVEILRAASLELVVGGQQQLLSIPAPDLADMLKAAGYEAPGPQDRITTNLPWLMGETPRIQVDRVVTRRVVDRVEIPFSTKGKPDPSLPRGQRRVIQAGQPGIAERLVEVTEINGEEVQRTVLNQTIIRPVVHRVVVFGSRQELGGANRGVLPATVKGPFIMEATAYTHTGNPTATGIYPFEGIVAVDPRVIPLGTLLYVEGYGYAEAQDTGGLIKGNIIDVFMDTEEKARQWGRRQVQVYILD